MGGTFKTHHQKRQDKGEKEKRQPRGGVVLGEFAGNIVEPVAKIGDRGEPTTNGEKLQHHRYPIKFIGFVVNRHLRHHRGRFSNRSRHRV